MTRNTRLAATVVAALAALVFAPFGAKGAEPAAAHLRIVLAPLNASAERGSGELTALGSKTRVVIRLQGEPRDAHQPANVHDGSCAAVAAIRYPLHDVRYGSSDTVIPVPLQRLLARPSVINVQSSAASLRAPKDYHYVSCGEIRTLPAG